MGLLNITKLLITEHNTERGNLHLIYSNELSICILVAFICYTGAEKTLSNRDKFLWNCVYDIIFQSSIYHSDD